jgi:hypothetical protein
MDGEADHWRDYLHAMQFRPPSPPEVRTPVPTHGLLGVTVTVRYIPLVPAASGTRMARAARTTMLVPDDDGFPLGRRGDPRPRRLTTLLASRLRLRTRGLSTLFG